MDITGMLFWAPLLTLLGSMLLSKSALHFFPQWKLLDHPEKYGHKRAPIPYPGGLVIVLVFLVSVLLLFPPELRLFGMLGGGAVLAIISFLDDRHGIHPLWRLLTQLGVGLLIAGTGTRIVFLGNPFGNTAFELSPLISVIVTVFWIVALINTVNWLDGVPGAAAGTSTIAGLFLGILALTPLVDQPELALMCFLFAAANLGFLFFNIPPPKMLNGDTGAMFSGFIIAILSIFSGGKMATAFLVLALPVFDAAAVIFHRLRSGHSPWRGGDKRHLHDQFQKRGLSAKQILFFFLLTATILGLAALFLKTAGKLFLLAFLGIFVFLLSWQSQGKK